MCFSTILKKTTTWFIRKGTLVENEVPSLFYLNTLLVIKNYISKLILIIVCKGLPAPPPPPSFLRQPPLDLVCPLFEIFVSLLLFSVPPSFKVFQTVSSTFTQHPSALNPTNQPFLVQANIKKVILPVQLSLFIKVQFLIF